ncbi:hypothetical protein EG832_03115 [bacterium]|nr:hypothetical protein [bacterium]
MEKTMSIVPLKGQRISAYIIIGVGIFHTLAHLLLSQPRQELFAMIGRGMFNTMGPDWATANFSISMSLFLGFSIIASGIMIVQMANRGWRVPLVAAISLLLIYIGIVFVGPNSGGWLALPSCVYLVIKASPRKVKRE